MLFSNSKKLNFHFLADILKYNIKFIQNEQLSKHHYFTFFKNTNSYLFFFGFRGFFLWKYWTCNVFISLSGSPLFPCFTNKFGRLLHNPNKTIWDFKKLSTKTSGQWLVCVKKRRLLWVLPLLARKSEPEIQQNPVSSHLPQTGTRSLQGKRTATLNSDLPPPYSPKHNKGCRLLSQTAPWGGLRTQGKRAREASWTWHHYEDNKDIAENTPGFGEEKILWKNFPVRKRVETALSWESDMTSPNLGPSKHTTKRAVCGFKLCFQ